MPGGNTSSTKKGYRNLKGGGQKSYDVRALSGAETIGDENNMQLFQYPGGDPNYHVDTEYGISAYNQTPEGGGYKGVKNGYLNEPADIYGGIKSRATKPANGTHTGLKRGSNPLPGGGFGDE